LDPAALSGADASAPSPLEPVESIGHLPKPFCVEMRSEQRELFGLLVLGVCEDMVTQRPELDEGLLALRIHPFHLGHEVLSVILQKRQL
jgi:hypothetical protein